MNDISIVSVVYSEDSYKKFKINYNLTNNMSNSSNWIWHVGLNNNQNLTDLKLLKKNNIIYHEGCELNDSIPSSIKGSYNHAECLNNIVQKITSKYLIVMDYDFYIIFPNWIEEIINHIEKYGIKFFGAPWHPKWATKYRNFPAVHFMIINLLCINKNDLDFRPDYNFKIINKKNKLKKIVPNVLTTKLNNSYLRKLSLVGSSKDTGIKVFKKFKNSRYELLIPVYDTIMEDYNKLTLMIDNILPNSYRLLPQENYFVQTPFIKNNHNYWEQFLWNGKPFGFHIRGEINKNNNYNDIIKYLKHTIGAH